MTTPLTLEQCLEFLAPDETLGQLFGRLGREKLSTGLQAIDRHLALRPGLFLEVCGGAGCGKSELLQQVAVHTLLDGTAQQQLDRCSSSADAEPFAEVFKKSVILIDLDGKFDGLRFIQILASHAAQRNPQLAALSEGGPQVPPSLAAQASANLASLQDDCLARMHVIKPHSSMQLLAALLSLPRLLAQCQEQHAPCALLLLDNIGAFYQQDKACRPPLPLCCEGEGQGGRAHGAGGFKVGRSLASAPAPQPPLSLNRVHGCVAAALQRLAAEHRLCVLATKFSTVYEQVAPDGHAVQLSHREYLPAAWHSLVTHRLLLGASRAKTWPAGGAVCTEVMTQLWQDGRNGPLEASIIQGQVMIAQ